MDEHFDYFYNDEGFGPPIYSELVSDDIIKKYKGKPSWKMYVSYLSFRIYNF